MHKIRKKAEFDLESRKFLTLLLMHPAPKYKFINFNLWGCGGVGRGGGGEGSRGVERDGEEEKEDQWVQ